MASNIGTIFHHFIVAATAAAIVDSSDHKYFNIACKYVSHIRHIEIIYTSYLRFICHINVINTPYTSYIPVHVMYTSYMTNLVTYAITCRIRYIGLQHRVRYIIWRYISVVLRFIFEVQYNNEVAISF